MPKKGNRTLRLPMGDREDPQSWHAMVKDYLQHMAVHNYSDNTAKYRREHLYVFSLWAQERDLPQPIQITKNHLERYQQHLFYYRKKNGEPISAHYKHGQIMSLRAFFKWASKQNRILYNPASELEPPRAEKRLPRYILTVADVETIMAQCNITDPIGLRDRAILETLYSTGMRRCEIASFKIHDLDFERGTVIIRQGKGKKDRMIPIGERALAWINRYLKEVRSTLLREPDDGTLFLATRYLEPLSLDQLSQLVHDYIKSANLGKQGGCHLLRHACATLMLEAGADIRFIQAILGHSNLKTTEIYTQVSIIKLKEVHNATHPAKLERNTHSA